MKATDRLTFSCETNAMQSGNPDPFHDRETPHARRTERRARLLTAAALLTLVAVILLTSFPAWQNYLTDAVWTPSRMQSAR